MPSTRRSTRRWICSSSCLSCRSAGFVQSWIGHEVGRRPARRECPRRSARGSASTTGMITPTAPRPAGLHALHEQVGAVAQPLGDFEDALARFLGGLVLAGQDQRDGHARDVGLARDVLLADPTDGSFGLGCHRWPIVHAVSRTGAPELHAAGGFMADRRQRHGAAAASAPSPAIWAGLTRIWCAPGSSMHLPERCNVLPCRLDRAGECLRPGA